ncbi:hypothetical protein HGRIS_007688 [Hohenbuehelia grisea]|uniref:Phospholipid/glycerol acyltransferase domain-containing protein n=1 Tax=Hohenbuehelia grisea TaxID=104357 RepID=A0ABR3J5M3_9AGAR
MAEPTTLHATPIPKRPGLSLARIPKAVIFVFVFNAGCLLANGAFLFLVPLLLLPSTRAREAYYEGIRYIKGAFASLMILMCQWFAPTKLSVTFEQTGQGRITQKEIEDIVVRDAHGNVTMLNLPSKSVFISNHQIYADWWYAWCFAYFMNAQRDVFIVLKKSLRWLPVVGWGMQFFRFIFLARSWASDRLQLATKLSELGREAQQEDKPFWFLLYPEGTVVSVNTRPVSKKFADKQGILDMTHVLLPRSTGLHYSLRSLAPRLPKLKLIDATVVYPGIPSMKYGQDYYTLRSIFFNGVPPPVIHIHLRVFDVHTEVPIGDISGSNPSVLPDTSPQNNTVEIDIPEIEKTRFDEWLRQLWRDKDAVMQSYYDTGSLSDDKLPAVVIPLKLREKREYLDAFCFFLPAVVGSFLWSKLRL